MNQEELEKEVERLQGELDVTGALLNFFIDALIRTGTPGVIDALRHHLDAMLKVARSRHMSDEMSAACLKGFEKRQAFFNCRVTNTLKNLNAVEGDDG